MTLNTECYDEQKRLAHTKRTDLEEMTDLYLIASADDDDDDDDDDDYDYDYGYDDDYGDDDDPNLEKKMEQIAEADKELSLRIFQLLPFLSPQEKLAAAAISIYSIDETDSQVILISPRKEYSDALKQAIEIIKQFSPGAKAELASAILDEIFDTE